MILRKHQWRHPQIQKIDQLETHFLFCQEGMSLQIWKSNGAHWVFQLNIKLSFMVFTGGFLNHGNYLLQAVYYTFSGEIEKQLPPKICQPSVGRLSTNSSPTDHHQLNCWPFVHSGWLLAILYMLAVCQPTIAHLSAYCWSTVYQWTADRFLGKLFLNNHTHFQVKITTLFDPITSCDQGWTVTGSAFYLNRTIATASFMTLSPNTRAYRSTSTWRSWKIASTVTIKQKRKNGHMTQYITDNIITYIVCILLWSKSVEYRQLELHILFILLYIRQDFLFITSLVINI